MENQLHIKNYNDLFRQLLFVGILVALGWLVVSKLSFFLGSALGAFTLYIVFRKVMFHVSEKWHWPRWLAGLTLTMICAIILAAAGYLVVKMVVNEIPSFNTTQLVANIEEVIDDVNESAGFEMISDSVISRAGEVMGQMLSSILNTTYNFAANLFMMLVVLYFMFTGGRKMEYYAYRYAPFKGESLSLLRSEVNNMVYSNAVGIPLILVAQTIFSCLIYWLIGINGIFFWGFITAICGLVPLVGTALVWVPIAIWLALHDQLGTGIILVLYGILVISNVDNVIRIVLMKQVNDTHPLIVIFGVILGIPLFGFWGIIFGPLLISALALLIKIYFVEYGLLTDAEQAAELACIPPQVENPVPLKSVNDLTAVKALRMLKTARPEIGKKPRPERPKKERKKRKKEKENGG